MKLFLRMNGEVLCTTIYSMSGSLYRRYMQEGAGKESVEGENLYRISIISCFQVIWKEISGFFGFYYIIF